MHFSSKSNIKSNVNVNYGDVQINYTCNIKFLGLISDSTLSWKDHINHLVTKLSAASYSIQILSVVMTKESLKMIYFAYVHSVMSYGAIWLTVT
jgi:3-deoxy-D-arabino-heptulosonate 7-phosphate (DAHP) synthase